MGHYRSAQVVKGDLKSSLSLQVNWQGVILQVIHCRLQQVRAGAEGHHKSVHITPVTAELTESPGHSRESRDVTLPTHGSTGALNGKGGLCHRIPGGLRAGHSTNQMPSAPWPLLSQAGRPGLCTVPS